MFEELGDESSVENRLNNVVEDFCDATKDDGLNFLDHKATIYDGCASRCPAES